MASRITRPNIPLPMALRGLVLAMLLLGALPGCEASKGKQPAQSLAARIGSKNIDILKRMSKTLAEAKTFSFEVKGMIDEHLDSGQLIQVQRHSRITVTRPDHLVVQAENGSVRWTAWYNGETLTMLNLGVNTFATESSPGTIDQMLDHMATKYNLVMPAADLLLEKVQDSLTDNIQYGINLGLHKVNGHECHHLLFHQADIDWQIWIDAGEKALPRKLVITYKQAPEQPQYVATFEDWKLNPKLADKTFLFVMPAGSQEVPMAKLLSSKEGEKP